MATLEQLIDRIEASAPGPETIAAFDYDGTLISGFSASAFYDHRIRRGELGPRELARTVVASTSGIHEPEDFAEFLKMSLGAWRGRDESEMDELGRRLLLNKIASGLRPEAYALLEAHRRQGHTLVVASSATRFQVKPMADELGIDHFVCTKVEVVDGKITGATAGPALWGVEKARALSGLADSLGLDLARAYAYTDGAEDIPFLELVGNPTAINPSERLAQAATERQWPILNCPHTGGIPGVRDIARTAAFYGGFAAAFGAGLGIGLLRRSRRTATDLAVGVGADVSLALAAVDIDVVEGEEYLWSARPAVFLINHQSKIDPVVVMKLLRGGFTGVAKAEAKNVPMFGALFQLAGVAFIERGNTAQAKAALEPAVAKVRDEGISLVISPEGTRTPTPRLGQFKKGAFHIAMQAEVPVVPIVFRNSGEVMWRGAQVVRTGTVEVAVLPPVDTSGWRPETVTEHRDEVRQMYVETLANWPRRTPLLSAQVPK